MNARTGLFERVALGAVGGVVGTFVLQALLKASGKWLPGTTTPMRENPGEYMVHVAEQVLPSSLRERVPKSAEAKAAGVMALAYGAGFGALYGALRPRAVSPLADGVVLGMASWAAGYLGWLPALGLMPPVWRQTPGQVVAPVAQHAAYGVAAAGAYDWLRRRV